MSKQKYALELENVNKFFKDANEQLRLAHLFGKEHKLFHSVKKVNFKVKRNKVFGVLGPNGCGKSTLIRMMTTLIVPDSGTIRIFGEDVVKNPDFAKDVIGRVSVDASFFMKLSALENLDYSAGLYALDRKDARNRSIEILKLLSFPEDKMKISVEKLSRGQQQKIAIARGFLANPRLLLLDEPTTGLDPVSKIDVQRYIKQVVNDEDITIVITSHDMDEIEKLCDELVIMNDGEIIAKGSPTKLKTSYCDDKLFEIQTTKMTKTKELLENIQGVANVKLFVDDKKQKRLTFETNNIDSLATHVIFTLRTNDVGFVSLSKVLPSLEDVFVKLTGKHLEN